jgi:uncharacterized protein (DUF885 family)
VSLGGYRLLMTRILGLCADYVDQLAVLDPVEASVVGIGAGYGAATDYSPDGYAARADLVRATLAELGRLPVTAQADRRAADHLRERLQAEEAWHASGEPLRLLRAPLSVVWLLRDSAELLPRGDEEQWRAVAGRLGAIPGMLASWRTSLETGLQRGLPAARRQALEVAVQAERYAGGTHDPLVAAYGEGPLAGRLAAAAAAAHAGYAETARYLRTDYAPRASAADAVGAERYAVAARLHLGANIDLVEAYEWGWEELLRIEAELAHEAGRVRRGASVDEATALLGRTQHVVGQDAYRGWLQDRHDQAIGELHGTHFDIAAPLRVVEVTLEPDSASGSAYYTPPSEDLTRPGRTWWPIGGRERFATWKELTMVFHEGVPGHHLQIGAARVAGERLSRFARFSEVPGHGEGWALYAERLADELGWFDIPGSRLGMLADAALRAARVVVDIGIHLDLPLPDGSMWTFETACEFLGERGRAEPHQVHPEVIRYLGWPAQAISYKLGERAWLAARDEARRRPGFDLKRWHTAALDLGPIGLGGLAEALRRID